MLRCAVLRCAVPCRGCVPVSDVGSVPELSVAAGGVWVGVDLDEPVGKHAGTVLGVSYFTARGGRHGTFVKPANVRCGDFPELDPFEEDEREEQQAECSSTAQRPDDDSGSHSTPQHQQQGNRSELYEEL